MKKKFLVVLLFMSVLFMTGCNVGSVDLKEKLSDENREKYILSELSKMYSRNFTIKLIEEDNVEVNCRDDGYCDYVDGASVYTYECSDDSGIVFEVNYTDAYTLDENEEYVESKLVSYYDDVIKFRDDNNKLITEYENIIKKYTSVYKRIYKAGYDHFNYYEEDYPDNFGYVYFILCTDTKAAKNLYNEVNLLRRHLAQNSGSKMTVEFYFMKEWDLYNAINVGSNDVDPGTSKETTLEKLTGLNEQIIGAAEGFNTRMYGGDTYNIEADHYYRSSFQYVAYYINDGDFQVKGLKSSADVVKPVVIEDYNYDDNIEFVEELEEE